MTDSALLGEFRVLQLHGDVEQEDGDGGFAQPRFLNSRLLCRSSLNPLFPAPVCPGFLFHLAKVPCEVVGEPAVSGPERLGLGGLVIFMMPKPSS